MTERKARVDKEGRSRSKRSYASFCFSFWSFPQGICLTAPSIKVCGIPRPRIRTRGTQDLPERDVIPRTQIRLGQKRKTMQSGRPLPASERCQLPRGEGVPGAGEPRITSPQRLSGRSKATHPLSSSRGPGIKRNSPLYLRTKCTRTMRLCASSFRVRSRMGGDRDTRTPIGSTAIFVLYAKNQPLQRNIAGVSRAAGKRSFSGFDSLHLTAQASEGSIFRGKCERLRSAWLRRNPWCGPRQRNIACRSSGSCRLRRSGDSSPLSLGLLAVSPFKTVQAVAIG